MIFLSPFHAGIWSVNHLLLEAVQPTLTEVIYFNGAENTDKLSIFSLPKPVNPC